MEHADIIGFAARGITIRFNDAAYGIPGGPWDFAAFYTGDDPEAGRVEYRHTPAEACAALVAEHEDPAEQWPSPVGEG